MTAAGDFNANAVGMTISVRFDDITHTGRLLMVQRLGGKTILHHTGPTGELWLEPFAEVIVSPTDLRRWALLEENPAVRDRLRQEYIGVDSLDYVMAATDPETGC